MKTIHKYELPPNSFPTLLVPRHAEFLSAGVQDDAIMTWWLVDSEMPSDQFREFHLAGTGQRAMWPSHEFVQTLQMPNGLVWHLFLRRD